MDAPTDDTAAAGYVRELKALGVTDVARTCEETYSRGKFESEGIEVHEMMFPDGSSPSEETLELWMQLITSTYASKKGIVAVHCVAGLGRAPVMAAVALMEMTGMDAMDAVEKIRATQKGAINARQLRFLQSYKPTRKGFGHSCCTPM
eukprot:CAMPEP_0194517654 /NCGR_PEP_ID=MMETSP0253-20130528/50891_1 /TAXON_ID=2966 /ORGANISM="Noctiluca scintillans" /LENGTH=147 /DNA_ID=CAMNT_0039361645 /DNA_START=157 /DNA_END=600 /DNA_ORIENTATION=-